jgi:hypothetical protein
LASLSCSGAEQLWDEVVEGIRHYFNKSLGCLLLYGPERYVYRDVIMIPLLLYTTIAKLDDGDASSQGAVQ